MRDRAYFAISLELMDDTRSTADGPTGTASGMAKADPLPSGWLLRLQRSQRVYLECTRAPINREDLSV